MMLPDLVAQAGHPTDLLDLEPLPANGSLAKSLKLAHKTREGGFPVLAEIKRSSPSQGPLLTGQVEEYLAAVRAGGAFAISAVTAGGGFAGDFQLLRAANATGCPTLMKDFVTTGAQLEAAVHHGASAVLLIERVLGAKEREKLVQQAQDRGLEVLLEVHSMAEAEAAQSSQAELIGVNSRDLDSLAINTPRALEIIASFPHRPHLLLSGVHDARDAHQAQAAGAAGILVGTSLARSRDPKTAVRCLRRAIAKVCGNRTMEDVRAARGADMVGVIVESEADRNVELADAHRLLRLAERQGAASVAVTRETRPSRLFDLTRKLRPNFVQIHGNLQAETVQALQGLGVGVLHAIAPGTVPNPGCDGSVTDSTAEGGSGQTHNGTVPVTSGIHLVAGGLHADNVAAAIGRSGATGADASSGLETKRTKDTRKVQEFIRQVRLARRFSHGT
jgi:indole-3-glycerol phosphate synthase/phosphoribosylanthranilate isomerase